MTKQTNRATKIAEHIIRV